MSSRTRRIGGPEVDSRPMTVRLTIPKLLRTDFRKLVDESGHSAQQVIAEIIRHHICEFEGVYVVRPRERPNGRAAAGDGLSPYVRELLRANLALFGLRGNRARNLRRVYAAIDRAGAFRSKTLSRADVAKFTKGMPSTDLFSAGTDLNHFADSLRLAATLRMAAESTAPQSN